ncbi:radical SAM/SPASM domain-containing protein [Saliterribacillus persicus]|uniref:Radical SAM core domain-containing protein n=1 Tax=Saliterribacillus persicus TaxID=930114 RepID=A0A368XYN9_9BACI|nr:radical SAM protein [Saliterribacillus persicus]RCW73103.1 uncharacterized protein DFR57_104101 [Saliterribacillus persicus]
MVERKLNTRRSGFNISDDEWSFSKFNVFSKGDDGTLLLYNSYTGAFGGIPKEEEMNVKKILKEGYFGKPKGIVNDLISGGMLVKKGVDENNRAELLRQTLDRSDYLHLILMPSEECNFRCVYCYENFPRGKMEESVIKGVITLIKSRISKLNHLTISWFGGEPLSEPEVIYEITDSIMDEIKKHNITFNANTTTNGYHLTPNLCKQLLKRGINIHNITLDGLEKDHDMARRLKGGEGTFNVIINNLIQLKNTNLNFKINIRCNFTQNTDINGYILYLNKLFSNDNRFNVFFRPVGKWGGPNDANLEVCEGREAGRMMLDADMMAINNNLPVALLQESLSPLGSVCYASKPNSFTIGADGTVYKCTVALESDFNKIGKLQPDGILDLDFDKLALWVISGSSEDNICKNCFFRPSCHGDSCPLVRIESGKRPCPKEKEHIKNTLKIMWKQHTMYNN